MYGTGAGTGMIKIIMQTRQIIILQDLVVEVSGYFAGVRGTAAILGSCGFSTAATTNRLTGATTTGSGVSVRFLNNTLGFLHFYTLGFFKLGYRGEALSK